MLHYVVWELPLFFSQTVFSLLLLFVIKTAGHLFCEIYSFETPESPRITDVGKVLSDLTSLVAYAIHMYLYWL